MRYKAVYTPRGLLETEHETNKSPKYKIGDYCCTSFNDLTFTVIDIRYNIDYNSFEYYSDTMYNGGWHLENIVGKGK